MCAQFYKILPGERNLCFTFLIRPTGAVWVHPNATWHFWTALIFQYYDQRLVMQPAWIISVHSVQAWLFETSPVLGLQGAGGSKNTISQVVSHELKIAEHSFPVRLPHCPPNPPAFLLRSNLSPPPSSLHPSTIHSAHCSVSWQKAAFPATWWRNLPEWKKKEGERKRRGKKRICQLIWTQIHDPHTLSLAPPIPPPCCGCHLRMFSQCFTIQFFWSVLRGRVN